MALALLALPLAGVCLRERAPAPAKARWDRNHIEPVALVERMTGTATVTREDAGRPLAPGDTVYVGEEIETDREASVALRTSPGDAQLTLGAQTRIAFDSAAELRTLAGRLDASVPNSLVQVIQTAHGRVLARGSAVTIEVREGGSEIAARDGVVRVEGSHDLRRLVHAGAHLFLAASPVPPSEMVNAR